MRSALHIRSLTAVRSNRLAPENGIIARVLSILSLLQVSIVSFGTAQEARDIHHILKDVEVHPAIGGGGFFDTPTG